MKMPTHILSGLAIGITCPNILLGIIFFIGSLFPDWLDRFFSFGNYERWESIHRKLSHNVLWWGIIGIVLQYCCVNLHLNIFYYFLFGVYVHLALDIITPTGLPYLPINNTKRISLRFIKNNSPWIPFVNFSFIVFACVWIRATDFSFVAWFEKTILFIKNF